MTLGEAVTMAPVSVFCFLRTSSEPPFVSGELGRLSAIVAAFCKPEYSYSAALPNSDFYLKSHLKCDLQILSVSRNSQNLEELTRLFHVKKI